MMCFASWSLRPLKNRIKPLVCIWNIRLRRSGFSCIRALIFGTEMRASEGPKFQVSLQCAHLPFVDVLPAVGLAVHVFPMLGNYSHLLGMNSALDTLSPALLLKQCAAQGAEGSVFFCPL